MAGEKPRPAKIPARSSLTPEERKRRRTQTLPTRLDRKLIEEYCAAVRSGAPLAMCADFVGVSKTTVDGWHARALAVEKKPWDSRTQFERLCVEFRKSVIRAEGEAGLRVHRAIAEAGGVIGQQKQITTTTKRYDPEGKLLETVEVTRSVLPDWRAALAVGRYRFSDVISDQVPPDPATETGAADISPQAVFERLQAVRRELAERNPIDVTSTEVRDE